MTYLLSQSYIPEGYSLVEQGIIYLNSNKLEEEITIEADGINIRALRYSTIMSLQWHLILLIIIIYMRVDI